PERIAGLAFGSARPEQWAEKSAPADFFDAKGDIESLAGRLSLAFEAAQHPACHPGRCARILANGRAIGFVGELHPQLQQKYELPGAAVVFELVSAPLLESEPPRYAGISLMPMLRRDLAAV